MNIGFGKVKDPKTHGDFISVGSLTTKEAWNDMFKFVDNYGFKNGYDYASWIKDEFIGEDLDDYTTYTVRDIISGTMMTITKRDD